MPADCWNEEINEADLLHVQKLLEMIHEWREAGVTGTTIMWSWLQRQIQALQKRANFGYQYLGVGDPSCMTSMEIFEPSGLKMLKKTLFGVSTILELLDLFCAKRPPKQVKCVLTFVLRVLALVFI